MKQNIIILVISIVTSLVFVTCCQGPSINPEHKTYLEMILSCL